MYKNFKKYVFVLFIHTTCYLILVTAPPVNAASLSLSINPSIIEIKAIPPTTVTSSLDIQNRGDAQIILQIQLKPFKAKGENGELEYSKETSEIFKCVKILDAGVPVENITLGPQQKKSLNLNINIPQANQADAPDEAGRDYYFSIIFISTDSSPIESSSSINQVGIATNVLLSIGPAEIPKATLEEFSSNIFFEKGPVPLTIKIKNIGAHFIKPKGEITIRNMFGQNIGKLDLHSVNVLSDSIRAIPNGVYMQGLRLKGNSNSRIKNSLDFKHPIVLWKESFLLGLYTATLNISMSDEGPTFTKSIHFFAVPLQVLIIIVVIVIAAIVIINRLKLYKNKNRTQI